MGSPASSTKKKNIVQFQPALADLGLTFDQETCRQIQAVALQTGLSSCEVVTATIEACAADYQVGNELLDFLEGLSEKRPDADAIAPERAAAIESWKRRVANVLTGASEKNKGAI